MTMVVRPGKMESLSGWAKQERSRPISLRTPSNFLGQVAIIGRLVDENVGAAAVRAEEKIPSPVWQVVGRCGRLQGKTCTA